MDFFDKYKTAILSLALGLLALLAWFNRFILDDAFISFRYAYNLAHGYGLVWNIGERVEGYTNFLWTMIMTIPMIFNWEPILFSYLVGIGLFVLSLWFTYKTALLISNSQKLAFFSMFFLGTCYSFSAYATSGLETQLQACLSVVVTLLILKVILKGLWQPKYLLGISFLSALAMLTRLDSVVILVVPYLVAGFYLFKAQTDALTKAKRLAFLCLPAAIILGLWFVWKIWFYGDILPNTFYAKAISQASFIRGLYYVYLFFFSYLLIPFIFLFLTFSRKIIRAKGLLVVSLQTILWFLYVVKVGGDYMEFRFIVPILPLFFIIVSSLIFSFVKSREVKVALVLLIFVGSLHHFFTFGLSSYTGSIETIRDLRQSDDWGKNWPKIELGKLLGKAFNNNSDIKISVTAAGAVPYYSRLTTTDMFGLNDKWVARHGVRLKQKKGQEFLGPMPGRVRFATLDYLLRRKVNFLTFQPPLLIKKSSSQPAFFSVAELEKIIQHMDLTKLPDNASVVLIPVSTYKLGIIYLIPDRAIDKVIKANSWEVYPIKR